MHRRRCQRLRCALESTAPYEIIVVGTVGQLVRTYRQPSVDSGGAGCAARKTPWRHRARWKELMPCCTGTSLTRAETGCPLCWEQAMSAHCPPLHRAGLAGISRAWHGRWQQTLFGTVSWTFKKGAWKAASVDALDDVSCLAHGSNASSSSVWCTRIPSPKRRPTQRDGARYETSHRNTRH